MYTCNFCKREDFPSRQSFNAHCRWCAPYLQHKQEQKTASGTAAPGDSVSHTTKSSASSKRSVCAVQESSAGLRTAESKP